MRKLLRVTGPTYAAVAILSQAAGAWTVTQTAPSLAWMHGLDMATIKQRLTAQGARWEWLEVSARFAANVTAGEQRVWNGIQNAIKADARDRAIVRNVRGKRKKVTE
jgi:hypothetical protein